VPGEKSLQKWGIFSCKKHLVGIIGEEVQFKDNKYLITIKKVEEEVRCDE